MNASLARIQEAGVTVRAERGNLKLKGRQSALSETLLGELRRAKPEIIKLLGNEQPASPRPSGLDAWRARIESQPPLPGASATEARAAYRMEQLRYAALSFLGLVEERLVLHDPVWLDATGCGDNQPRLRIVDAHRKLIRGKPAEDDRMDGSDPGAGQHRDQRLGDHGHVENDPVALLHTRLAQDAGQGRNLMQKIRVGVYALLPGDGAIVDDSGLAAAAFHMPVYAIICRIGDATCEPASINALAGVQDALGLLDSSRSHGQLPPRNLPDRVSSAHTHRNSGCLPALLYSFLRSSHLSIVCKTGGISQDTI